MRHAPARSVKLLIRSNRMKIGCDSCLRFATMTKADGIGGHRKYYALISWLFVPSRMRNFS